MKLLNTPFFIYFLVTALNANAQRTCPRVDEYYRGRHKIEGMQYGHPYTTFDRKHGSFENRINNIRVKIKNEFSQIDSLQGDIFRIYLALYNHANKPNPVAETAGDGIIYRDVNLKPADVSSVPTWAKNNAFVFLQYNLTFKQPNFII